MLISEVRDVYETVSVASDQFDILFENVVDSPSLSPSDRPLYDAGSLALMIGYS